MLKVVDELRKTSKGRLVYHRQSDVNDICKELDKLICLPVTLSRCQKCEAREKDDSKQIPILSVNNRKQKEINDGYKNIPDPSLVDLFAQTELSIIQYETERIHNVKKQLTNRKTNWEKHVQEALSDSERKPQCFKLQEENAREKETKNQKTNWEKHVQEALSDSERKLQCFKLQEENAREKETKYENKEKRSKEEILISVPEKIHKPQENQQVSNEVTKVQNQIKQLAINEEKSKRNHIAEEIHESQENQQVVKVQDQIKQLAINEERSKREEEMRNELETMLDTFISVISEIEKRIKMYPVCQTKEIMELVSGMKEISNGLKCYMADPGEQVLSIDLNVASLQLAKSNDILFTLDSIIDKSKQEESVPNFPIGAQASATNNIFPVAPTQPVVDRNLNNKSFISTNDILSHPFSTSLSNFPVVISPQTTTQPQIHFPVSTSEVSQFMAIVSPTTQNVIQLTPVTSLLQNQLIDAESKMDETEEMESNLELEDNFDKSTLSQYVDKAALEEFINLTDYVEKWKTLFQSLLDDFKWKKAKFDLQKAINTPINSTSDISVTHLCNKMKRLGAFLSGQSVEIAGKMISINVCPHGKEFCMDLLAKKLVVQGENQVSSRPEAAFPLSALTVYLCQCHPELIKLFLGHIYKKCPYLLPYYIPHKEGQIEEEHYKELGYTYTDGIIEKQVMFLKRMSGIIRLYAAVIQTPPVLSKPHPHSVKHGWMLISRIMNLEPRPDITATVLGDFLEVAGHIMEKKYGKQFQKLLKTLATDFIPKIKQVSLDGGGGPLQRLESFLEDTFRQGRVVPPSGMLDSNFWRM